MPSAGAATEVAIAIVHHCPGAGADATTLSSWAVRPYSVPSRQSILGFGGGVMAFVIEDTCTGRDSGSCPEDGAFPYVVPEAVRLGNMAHFALLSGGIHS